MNTYNLNASVQYNDMRGTASADWQMSMTDIEDFAKENGIDITKYRYRSPRVSYPRCIICGLHSPQNKKAL